MAIAIYGTAIRVGIVLGQSLVGILNKDVTLVGGWSSE